MTCLNLFNSCAKPAENYIKENWVDPQESSFFKRRVLSGGCQLALTPLPALASIVDTAVGIVGGVAAFGSAGSHMPTWRFAMDHLQSSRSIVAYPYLILLRALNPEFELTTNTLPESGAGRYLAQLKMDEWPLIGAEGNGFTAHFAREALRSIAKGCYNSDNFFKRHVAARLTYPLLAVSLVITRVVDSIIGVIGAPLSLITLGKIESLNNLTYRALQSTGIIEDLFYCTIKLINPLAGTRQI